MIRVRKPAKPPPILASGRGRAETESNRTAYVENPGAYEAGLSTFDFKSRIYGAKSVKNALIRAQHGKCCFCEAKITHVAYGDVEHFRPKAGYRQCGDDPLARPGYYWLAYAWSNLYLACQLCNQRYKKNLFPLLDADHRCRDHLGDLDAEEPLFLDPGASDPLLDPGRHIRFEAEQPRAIDGSLQGKVTIEALGLRREALRERRFDRYRMLSALRDVADTMPGDSLGRQAQELLDEATLDNAEYASMARSLLG